MVEPPPLPPHGPANPSLHILFLDPSFHDGVAPGPTRTFDLASRLVGSGHKVTVLCMGSDETRPDGLIVRARRAAPRPGLDLPPVDVHRYSRWAVLQMWRVADVDAVVTVAEPYGFLPFAALFAWWRGVPLIADVRDVAPESPPPGAPTGMRVRAWLGHWGRRFALMLPRRVVAASQAVSADLLAQGVKAEHQIQSVFGCDTRLFAFAAGRDNTFLRDFPDLAGRPLLVFAGRFTPDRDLIAVINLAAALREWAPDVAVVLCGDGPARAQLEEHARAVGVLDGNLRIIPALPRRALPDVLAAAAMVLSVPRRNDTAGGFFDALAAGRPVLALGNSWQRTLIESRGAGFGLPAGDPRNVAKEIAEILRDGDGLRRAGQQAAALAASRFNVDRIAADQRAFIEDLVGAEPRAVVMRRRALRVKRVMDVVVSAAALIVLSPLILILLIVIAVKLGWPPVFAEDRVGLKTRPFSILKLRTLTDGEDPTGALLPEHGRQTEFGRLLRRSGFDAVLQFVNVLMGAMSLVGPEPLPPSYLHTYTQAQRRRHDVRPGMTGLAQVDGRNHATWEDIFAADLAYVDRLSFGLDCAILLRTLMILLRGGDVTTHGRDSLPPFTEIVARREGAEDI